MAIGKKPQRKPDVPPAEAAVEAFIHGADHAPGTALPSARGKEKAPKAPKERVILSFDSAMLDSLDRRAERRGLSRSAWVRMVVAKALEEDD